MSVYPLLPFALPLLSSAALWALPRQRLAQLERWLFAAALLLSISALGLATGRNTSFAELATGLTLPGWEGALLQGYGGLSTVLAAALLLTLALGQVAQPFERSRAAATLGVAGLGVAACGAGNLLTLTLWWGTIDLYTPLLLRHTAPLQAERRSGRMVFIGMASTLALLAAAWTMQVEAGHTRLEAGDALSAALPWLTAAAVLRLAPWPVHANYASTEGSLLSRYAGAALWLRLTPMLGPTWLPGLAPVALATLWAACVLMAVSPRLSGPYLGLVGASLMVLAPLCHPLAGGGVALLVLVNQSWAGALLALEPGLRALLPRRWWFVPLALALGALAGMPLTAGLVTHWAAVSWVGRLGSGAVVLTGAALTLLASALWRHGLLAQPPAADARRHWTVVSYWAAGGAVLLGLGLVALGLAPQWLTTSALRVPGLAYLWSRSSGPLYLLAAAWPIAIGYLLARALGEHRRLHTALALLGTVFEADWLYVTVERALALVGRWLARLLATLEGALSLSWSLLWGVTLLLLLIKG